MSIDTTHVDYAKNVRVYQIIEDITTSQNLSQYLVPLNPLDKSEENKRRNEQYAERAIFYDISGQTVRGLVGTVFRRDPTLEVPEALEYVADNIDGAGVSIYQQTQQALSTGVRKGRGGVAVSFPQTEGQVSRADIVQGRVVATTHFFQPESIINWRTTRDGARVKLSLVVIRETDEEIGPDGYSVEEVEIIREMFLSEEDGTYWERYWRNDERGWHVTHEYQPRDASNQPWGEIPFMFIGSENNDVNPDHPLMKGIVEVNIGHYRNSADYEDSVWFTGQVQPWMSGLTKDYVDFMTDNGMYVGSRMLLAVPEGEQFGFAQAGENTMVRQAMKDKVDMMIGLGARMIQPGSAVKTAEQASGEREAQHSMLSLVAANVSEAYTRALQWVARYMGESEEECLYELSQDFVQANTTPQELQQMVAGFLQGAIPVGDYVRYMKRHNLFDQEKDVEDYAEEIGSGGEGGPPMPRGGF